MSFCDIWLPRRDGTTQSSEIVAYNYCFLLSLTQLHFVKMKEEGGRLITADELLAFTSGWGELSSNNYGRHKRIKAF